MNYYDVSGWLWNMCGRVRVYCSFMLVSDINVNEWFCLVGMIIMFGG